MKNKLNIFLICVIFVLCTIIVLLSCNVYKLSNDGSITGNIDNDSHSGNNASGMILDVDTLCQYPQLPTGCEIVSTTMLLNYYGINISATDFATDYITCSDEFIKSKYIVYGPDPNAVFVGDPFDVSGYGCYAPAIEKAINYSDLNCKAEVISGKTLDELCDEYISNDDPLLVWVTLRMEEPLKGEEWYLSGDIPFTWTSGEHCVVLVGFDEKYYFFNDPATGGVVAYKKDISEQRFKDMGAQALRIVNE